MGRSQHAVREDSSSQSSVRRATGVWGATSLCSCVNKSSEKAFLHEGGEWWAALAEARTEQSPAGRAEGAVLSGKQAGQEARVRSPFVISLAGWHPLALLCATLEPPCLPFPTLTANKPCPVPQHTMLTPTSGTRCFLSLQQKTQVFHGWILIFWPSGQLTPQRCLPAHNP